jgi:hypothetical protein
MVVYRKMSVKISSELVDVGEEFPEMLSSLAIFAHKSIF